MIVVDTNVIAYLFLPGKWSAQARAIYRKDPEWAAPVLWRSEFRNVLALYLRRAELSLTQAFRIMGEAEFLMQGGEGEVTSSDVLSLTAHSRCSAYDCEFVALAQVLGVPLITSDEKLLKDFPSVVISMARYAGS